MDAFGDATRQTGGNGRSSKSGGEKTPGKMRRHTEPKFALYRSKLEGCE